LRRLPRLWTSRQRALPDWIIIGAMRSGSSSLYHNLTEHPQVLPALRKEVQFFDENFDQGMAWYRSNFPTMRAMKRRHEGTVMTGEGSPAYIFHPLAPERIAEALPDVRLIAALRNPVDRTWSHYHHSVKHRGETLSFEDAIAAESERVGDEIERVAAGDAAICRAVHYHGYMIQGEYARFMERWLAVFPKEQMLVLRAEDLFETPDRYMAEVIEFIGLPPVPTTWATFNTGSQSDMPADVRERLTEHFRPHNQRLADMLGWERSWDD